MLGAARLGWVNKNLVHEIVTQSQLGTFLLNWMSTRPHRLELTKLRLNRTSINRCSHLSIVARVLLHMHYNIGISAPGVLSWQSCRLKSLTKALCVQMAAAGICTTRTAVYIDESFCKPAFTYRPFKMTGHQCTRFEVLAVCEFCVLVRDVSLLVDIITCIKC